MIHDVSSRKVLDSFYTVYNELGTGFLEKVYENALLVELKRNGVEAIHQVPVAVWYRECKVGEYCADILIENSIILEVKSTATIIPEHEAQLINYLKATRLELGFILNFGPKPQFIRRVLSNEKKHLHAKI